MTINQLNPLSIISASRRTDIPRFYPRWFAERRKAGSAEFRNSFGGKGKVSLQDEDVAGFLFWTRFAKPFAKELAVLLDAGLPCVFQYTITGYGRDVEPHTPETGKAMADFLTISSFLPSAECIQWRYDPIVINDEQSITWHMKNFEKIASTLKGATKVVNTSFIEPYVKAVRRMADPTIQFRQVDAIRHKSVKARYPDLIEMDAETGKELVMSLAEIARQNDMELRMCANPEWDIPKSQCCGMELFAPYGTDIQKKISAFKPGPSRAACCCLKTVDIGMDNTCLGGCKYCYVVTSHELAMRNFRSHQPDLAMLR